MGNREKLLASAKRLIAEKGYGEITARDLVSASQTNLASIGYHFGSKDALLTEAVLDSFTDWGADVTGSIVAITATEPVERRRHRDSPAGPVSSSARVGLRRRAVSDPAGVGE